MEDKKEKRNFWLSGKDMVMLRESGNY